jgi:hypothetical protein
MSAGCPCVGDRRRLHRPRQRQAAEGLGVYRVVVQEAVVATTGWMRDVGPDISRNDNMANAAWS